MRDGVSGFYCLGRETSCPERFGRLNLAGVKRLKAATSPRRASRRFLRKTVEQIPSRSPRFQQLRFCRQQAENVSASPSYHLAWRHINTALGRNYA